MTCYIAIGSDGRAILTRHGFKGMVQVHGPYYAGAEAIEQVQEHNRHWVETIVSNTKRAKDILAH